jgi:Fur family ferric uptake transcriptional regulator/Fur family peroxide stress response transcriptional regulator
MTSLQKSMLSLLKGRSGHFTAESVLTELRKEHPSASLATVYRNLDIFTRERRIRKVPIPEGQSVYEGNMIPHEHAVCAKCGKVSDFTIPRFSELIAENVNGEIVSIDVSVKHICGECQNTTGSETWGISGC